MREGIPDREREEGRQIGLERQDRERDTERENEVYITIENERKSRKDTEEECAGIVLISVFFYNIRIGITCSKPLDYHI